MDQAAEPVSPQHPDIHAYCRRMRASCGRVLLKCPVRPVRIVMAYVLAEDQPQVPLSAQLIHPCFRRAHGRCEAELPSSSRLARLDLPSAVAAIPLS